MDYSLSTRESIYVSWDLNQDGPGLDANLITGYKLWMDDGKGSELKVVLNTVGYNAHIDSYLA